MDRYVGLDPHPKSCTFGVMGPIRTAQGGGDHGEPTPLPHAVTVDPRCWATLCDLDELNAGRTRTPSLANMSIRASVLNRSSLPRRRSLTRG
jgi:hypothetical protein